MLEVLALPNWIVSAIVTGFFTFVMTMLVIVLRNRRSLLTYHVDHNPVGISTYDSVHGEVAVTVGGVRVKNLYSSNVWLVNHSMRDVEDFTLKVYCDNLNMRFMSEQTHIDGTVDSLEHSPEFEVIKNELVTYNRQIELAKSNGDEEATMRLYQSQAEKLRTWYSQRWYVVPVLARGQTIRFTYLTNVESDQAPQIRISCQKSGVRIKYRLPYQVLWHIWGVPLAEASIAGIVFGTFVWLLVVTFVPILWLAALISFVVGISCNIPGAWVLKLWKWLRERLIG